ncbi:MAG TPA: FmdB family zinc ribbon protein [Sporichthyaceae bacterium]|nr:FmdB family zinc ribbon protein [Sporichthyaceae bacterium]
MPTYQYACTKCGHELEAVQKFTDDPLTECPDCSGRLRKVFSAVGVVFKGSGFYRTDSRAKSSAGESGSDSKSTPKSDGGKSEGSKSEGGKSDGGGSTSATKSDSGSTKKAGGESAGTSKKSGGESAA